MGTQKFWGSILAYLTFNAFEVSLEPSILFIKTLHHYIQPNRHLGTLSGLKLSIKKSTILSAIRDQCTNQL